MQAIRKFGTDILNLPKIISSGKPLAAAPATLVQSAKSDSAPLPSLSSSRDALSASVLGNELDNSLSVNDIADIVIPTERKPQAYTLDFLFAFSDFGKDQPIEGLLEEVTKGFVNPNPPVYQPRKFPGSARKVINKKNPRAPGSAPGSSKRRTFDKDVLSSVALSLNMEEDKEGDAFVITIQETEEKKEWRIKAVQKTPRTPKPKESDEKRLAARQKQIDIGMNTEGYRKYLEQVPADKRGKEGPRTPDIFQICSKRSWDGQVRKWRRELHAYDPDTPLVIDLEEDDIEDEESIPQPLIL